MMPIRQTDVVYLQSANMFNKILIALTVPVLLQCGSGDHCDSQCSQSNTNQSALMKTKVQNLSCKLTATDLQKRKRTTIAILKSLVQEKKETENGYSFRFHGDDNTINLLTEFVKTERQCCDFFEFNISIRSNSILWLDISGPEGSKEFITGELKM